MQQNNEGEKTKGRWVLWFFFWVLFYGGSFFFFNVFVKPIDFFITNKLVITYKLNTIKGFCHSLGYFHPLQMTFTSLAPTPLYLLHINIFKQTLRDKFILSNLKMCGMVPFWLAT